MRLWRQPFDTAERAPKPGHLDIDRERCKGCGYCVDFCPRQVLKMSTELSPKGYNFAIVEEEAKCLACGFCQLICPEFAIKVTAPTSDGD